MVSPDYKKQINQNINVTGDSFAINFQITSQLGKSDTFTL